MSLDPGTIATIGTVAGGVIAAAAAFFKGRDNGTKLDQIHVLVDGNFSDLQRQLDASVAHSRALEASLSELIRITREDTLRVSEARIESLETRLGQLAPEASWTESGEEPT